MYKPTPAEMQAGARLFDSASERPVLFTGWEAGNGEFAVGGKGNA
jgi:hypothetical protein